MHGHAQMDLRVNRLFRQFKLKFQEINLNFSIDDVSPHYAIKFDIK